MAKRFVKRVLANDERNSAINEVDELLLVSQIAAERKLRFRRRFSKCLGAALIAFSLLLSISILLSDYIAVELRVGFSSIYLLILSVELLRG